MSLKDDAFPSSEAFEILGSYLASDQNKKDAIKQGQGIYVFQLKNSAGKEESWSLDLKNEGSIAKGAPKGKADVTLILSDENFQKLVDQKVKAQQLFMSGKLKVKGNIMKSTKLEPILSKAGGAKSKL